MNSKMQSVFSLDPRERYYAYLTRKETEIWAWAVVMRQDWEGANGSVIITVDEEYSDAETYISVLIPKARRNEFASFLTNPDVPHYLFVSWTAEYHDDPMGLKGAKTSARRGIKAMWRNPQGKGGVLTIDLWYRYNSARTTAETTVKGWMLPEDAAALGRFLWMPE